MILKTTVQNSVKIFWLPNVTFHALFGVLRVAANPKQGTKENTHTHTRAKVTPGNIWFCPFKSSVYQS